eukprot:6213571-Pleurochrysis_carterae.AAC.1
MRICADWAPQQLGMWVQISQVQVPTTTPPAPSEKELEDLSVRRHRPCQLHHAGRAAFQLRH